MSADPTAAILPAAARPFLADAAVPALPAGSAMPAWRRVLWLALLAVLLCYLPVVLDSRALFGMRLSNTQLLNISLTQVNLMLIILLGALSLNYLTGVAGLVSIGHGAFYALGALAGAVVGTQAGLPFPVALAASALLGAVAGLVAGLPSLRVRGLYFVLSTFALHYIVVFGLSEYQFRVFDVVGIPFNDAALGPVLLDSPLRWYFFLLVLCTLVYWGLANSLRSREGRALMATRDHELAAGAAGIDVRVLRLKAFALSSAIAAVAGTLYSYYMTNVNAEFFSINFAIQFVAIIIIGGMGSLVGSILGSAVWLLLPAVITGLAAHAGSGDTAVGTFLTENKPQLVNLLFGGLVIVLLIFAPEGIAGIGRSVRGALAARAGLRR